MVSYYFTQKNYTLFEKVQSNWQGGIPLQRLFFVRQNRFCSWTTTGFDNRVFCYTIFAERWPGEHKANEILGEIIYDELNKRLEKEQRFSSGEKLETIMIPAFKKRLSQNRIM